MEDSLAEMEKITPVVTPDEVQWLTDMGLGRGVDATKADLWKEKSSFQVQSVSKSLDNIIGTDEGGARNYFEREVSSISSRQTQLKLSVVEPHSSVHIGVDAVHSKSETKSLMSVGEEIATRTISFRSSFDDLLLERIHKKTILQSTKLAEQPSASISGGNSMEVKPDMVKSFEEQLSDWLIDRLHIRGKSIQCSRNPSTTADTDSSTAKLARYFCTNITQDDIDNFVSDCLLFVKKTGVTHYIHSIRLGAKRYRSFTTSEYKKKVGAKGEVGMQLVAKSQVSHTSSWMSRNSSMNVQEIGKISDGQVKRGVGHEAVISFKIMPIQTLVTSHHVNEALKTALRNYMVEKATRSSKHIVRK